MTSTRLPGKVLLPAAGKPLLEHMVERLRRVARRSTRSSSRRPPRRPRTRSRRSPTGSASAASAAARTTCSRACSARRRPHDADADRRDHRRLPADRPGGGRPRDRALRRRAASTTAPTRSSGPIRAAWTCRPSRPPCWPRSPTLTDDPADREHVSLYIYEHPERYRLRSVRLDRPETGALRLTVDTPEDYALDQGDLRGRSIRPIRRSASTRSSRCSTRGPELRDAQPRHRAEARR